MWELDEWLWMHSYVLTTLVTVFAFQHIVMYGTLLKVFNSSFHTNAHNSTSSRILQSWQLYWLLITFTNCEMKWEKVAIFCNYELLPQLWDFALFLISYIAKEGFLKKTAWNLLYIFGQKVLQFYYINERGLPCRNGLHSNFPYANFPHLFVPIISAKLKSSKFQSLTQRVEHWEGERVPKLNDLESCKR